MSTITLTVNEQKVVQSALEAYRKIKSAERMLKGQKDNAQFPAYDSLLEIINTTQEKVK